MRQRVSCHVQQTSCNSCGKRLDEWEASKAAAYGGRCANCHKLHKEGSYCPVCSKVSLYLWPMSCSSFFSGAIALPHMLTAEPPCRRVTMRMKVSMVERSMQA